MVDWNDYKSVLTEVEKRGCTLKYADDSLKANESIVLAAVQNHGYALHFADDSLKSNERIVLAAVQNDGRALQYADDSLKSNESIVLAAAQNRGCALGYADDSLRDDEFFLALLQDQGIICIEVVSERIKKELKENPKYLEDFAPAMIKPARRA